jgi:hypothetical protein
LERFLRHVRSCAIFRLLSTYPGAYVDAIDTSRKYVDIFVFFRHIKADMSTLSIVRSITAGICAFLGMSFKCLICMRFEQQKELLPKPSKNL